MSEGRLTNVYCWKPEPGLQWRIYEGTTGTVIDAASRQEALALFRAVWGERTPFQLIEHAPPRPRRPDDPKPAVPGIEGDTVAVAFHRAVVKAFHSDHHGAKTYSGDEVLAIINRAWDTVRR